jgi:hypothetical protein
MSKVKIQGHASGTGVLTVTAPNTSTDRTITLPDGTGTLLTTDGDGSSLTGVGVDGISSSADATAITIDSSENVGIGTSSPSYPLDVEGSTNVGAIRSTASNSILLMPNSGVSGGDNSVAIASNNDDFFVRAGDTEQFRIKSDGRGLSEFTAKAWLNFDGTGTIAIRDSHNISGIVDEGVGACTVTFANTMADDNYSFSADGSLGGGAFIYNDASNTTSTCYVRTRDADGTSYVDRDAVSVIIFGG